MFSIFLYITCINKCDSTYLKPDVFFSIPCGKLSCDDGRGISLGNGIIEGTVK
jgi:hypothetical protein